MAEKKFKFVEGKSAVSQLQERLIRNGIKPKYDLIYDSTTRPCAVTKFTWQVSIEDVVAFGTGNTKKAAKQEAAKNMLIQISRDEEIALLQKVSEPVDDNFVNRIGNLSMFCSRNSLPPPNYKEYETDGPPHIRQFFCDCIVSKYLETGVAKTKKDAKQRAAHQMYQKLLSEIANPNDANLLDSRLTSEFSCKIKKSDPWLKSEKIASCGIDAMETSDGEESRTMSPEPNYATAPNSNIDPTQPVDYRPGYRSNDTDYRSAEDEASQCSTASSDPQNPESNIIIANEERLEKKFKINLSLFTRSNMYKETESPSEIVESGQNIDSSFKDSSTNERIGTSEAASVPETLGGERTVKIETKYSQRIQNDSPNETDTLEEEQNPVGPNAPEEFVHYRSIKTEKVENSLQGRVEHVSDGNSGLFGSSQSSDTSGTYHDAESEIDIFEHTIESKADVPKSCENIPASRYLTIKTEHLMSNTVSALSDQTKLNPIHSEIPLTKDASNQENTLSETSNGFTDKVNESIPIKTESKSSIESLINSLKSRFPELLTSNEYPADPEVEKLSDSQVIQTNPRSIKTEGQQVVEENESTESPPQSSASVVSSEVTEQVETHHLVPSATNHPMKSKNTSNNFPWKAEIMDIEEALTHEFTPTTHSSIPPENSEEKTLKITQCLEIDPNIETNNNNYSMVTKQEVPDLKQAMHIAAEPNSALSELQTDVRHLKLESEGNSVSIKPERNPQINSQDQADTENAMKPDDVPDRNEKREANVGDSDAATSERIETSNNGRISAPKECGMKNDESRGDLCELRGKVASNNSGPRTLLEQKICIKELDTMKISNYHYMMMSEYGIDLRQKVLGKICDLIEAMMKCDSNKNPHIVDEGIIMLHDILLLIDLFVCKVIYRAHDLHYIVVIHVNSISEIVEMTKGWDLNEITRVAFFRVIERLKKMLQ